MSQSLPALDLISIPEAAHRVGLHVDTLYRLCRRRQFPPAIQIGTRWRVVTGSGFHIRRRQTPEVRSTSDPPS